jgi:hypothetical protein
MTPLDAFWHLINALAVPFGVALFASCAVKGLWYRQTAGTAWWAMTMWAYVPGLVAYIGAWAYAGVEGTMLGYALLVGAAALGLWAKAFLWPAR